MENQEHIEATGEELRELLKIRRDKLKNLQDLGKDPFEVTKFEITHHTTDILENVIWEKPHL